MLPVTHGVPQGSILGPLAFLIFINDLPNVIKCCQFKLSADDTVYALQTTISMRFLITYKLQSDLDNMCNWCRYNKMTINVKKMLMPFDTHNRITHLSELDIRLGWEHDGNILGLVQTFKYLGIILDSTLTYKQHLSHIEKTVSHKTFLLRKLRPYLGLIMQVWYYISQWHCHI